MRDSLRRCMKLPAMPRRCTRTTRAEDVHGTCQSDEAPYSLLYCTLYSTVWGSPCRASPACTEEDRWPGYGKGYWLSALVPGEAGSLVAAEAEAM